MRKATKGKTPKAKSTGAKLAQAKSIPAKGAKAKPTKAKQVRVTKSPSRPAKSRLTKASATQSSPARPKTISAKPRLKIPPILLEDDPETTEPTVSKTAARALKTTAPAPKPPVSGPGQRYALRPIAPREAGSSPVEERELPEAYGTQELLLTARDPHWLYAHWDLTHAQQEQYRQRAESGQLVLRVYRDQVAGTPVEETPLAPDSRSWFVHVGQGGTRFQAELGYYDPGHRWESISTSRETLTPPDAMSDDLSFAVETIPPDLPFAQLLELIKQAAGTQAPLAEALQELRATGHPGLPAREQISAKHWTPKHEDALARMVNMDAVRHVWIGSLEITEMLRRQLRHEWASGVGPPSAWPAAGVPFAPAGVGSAPVSGISSQGAGPEAERAFWFNINAELIIYGATEPGAEVTLEGRPIRLRDDGTFSFRFALPDGSYGLEAVATAADGTDQRSAKLDFRRRTRYRGTVGQHPQEPHLKPPRPENLS